MFARAVRSSCAARLSQQPQNYFAVCRIGNQHQLRFLTTTRSLRNQKNPTSNASVRMNTNRQATDPIPKTDATAKKDASTAKSGAASKPTAKQKEANILNTSAATNKEQRKADWAIMKDLAKYLWPKVWVCLPPSATSWLRLSRGIGEPNYGSEPLLHC